MTEQNDLFPPNESAASPETGSPTEEKKPENRSFEQCPRCGWHVTDNPEPPQEDLEEYLRSVLGGRRFVKKYMLFDGKLEITMQSALSTEADFLNKIVASPVPDTDTELRELISKAKLLFHLKAVNLDGQVTEFDIPELTDPTEAFVTAEFDKRFGQLDETIIRGLVRVLMLFSTLLQLLISRGFDENFWQGAGPF